MHRMVHDGRHKAAVHAPHLHVTGLHARRWVLLGMLGML